MEDRPPDAPAPIPPSDDWPPSPPPPDEWPPPYEPPPEPPPAAVIPWEQPGLPWTTALIETVKLLLSKPRQAFERMPITGDPLRPFVFAILLGWFGVVFGVLWSLPFRHMMPAGSPYVPFQMPDYALPLFALFAPILVVIAILFSATIVHVGLMIVGGANSGFAATLRVFCYARAPEILQVLPFCGGFIAQVAEIVLLVQGLAVAHRISIGKATSAVLLPVVLCCVCGSVLFIIGAALVSQFSEGMQH